MVCGKHNEYEGRIVQAFTALQQGTLGADN